MTKICSINRIITAIIVICLMITLVLPLSAFAAESGKAGDGIEWNFSGNTLTFSGEGDMTDYSDASMPPWYRYAGEITAVIVEEGITSVGDIAFFGCDSLTNVYLPSTVKRIGIRAFYDCKELSFVSLLGVEEIGESAFECCRSLNGITLPEGLRVMGDKAFFLCESLSSITVPSTVEQFGMVVFAHCSSLVRAEILCPIEKLPDWTFYGCKSLVAVSLPESVKELGDSVFHDCSTLSQVYYPGDTHALYEKIVEDNSGISTGGGVAPGKILETYSSTSVAGGITTQISVTDTKEAKITVKRTVNNSAISKYEIFAVLQTDAGWNSLSSILDGIIEEASEAVDPASVIVSVNMPGGKVSGAWLDRFAGEKITLDLTTSKGAKWRIRLQDVEDKVDSEAEYDLDYKLAHAERRYGISSNKIFSIEFYSAMDFPALLSVNLGSSYVDHHATLYEENGSKYSIIQNVQIGDSGIARFALANVDTDVSFYIGIDSENVSYGDAFISEGDDSVGGLTDGNGIRYEITGRSSRWGITGGQFALYVGVGVGFLILVIAVVMIVRNHAAKSRAAEEERRLEEERRRRKAKAASDDEYIATLKNMLGKDNNKEDK